MHASTLYARTHIRSCHTLEGQSRTSAPSISTLLPGAKPATSKHPMNLSSLCAVPLIPQHQDYRCMLPRLAFQVSVEDSGWGSAGSNSKLSSPLSHKWMQIPAAQGRKPAESQSRCSLAAHWTCSRWHRVVGPLLLHCRLPGCGSKENKPRWKGSLQLYSSVSFPPGVSLKQKLC